MSMSYPVSVHYLVFTYFSIGDIVERLYVSVSCYGFFPLLLCIHESGQYISYTESFDFISVDS